jgi:hypothetical protein
MGAYIDEFSVSPREAEYNEPIRLHVKAHVDFPNGILYIEWFLGEKRYLYKELTFWNSITYDADYYPPYKGTYLVKVTVQERFFVVLSEDSRSETVTVKSGPGQPFEIPSWVPYLAAGVLVIGAGALLLRSPERREKVVGIAKKGIEKGIVVAKKGIEVGKKIGKKFM